MRQEEGISLPRWELPTQHQARDFREKGREGRSPSPGTAQGDAISVPGAVTGGVGTAVLIAHPSWGGSSQGYLCSLPGKPETSFCQGNSKEPGDKLTNFPFALFFFLFSFFSPLISLWKSFGEISERAVSATSLLLHHSEHCNIIKLVKRKQWCLSFLQTARCSFQGEQHPRLCPAPVGEGRIPLSFLKHPVWLPEQKKTPSDRALDLSGSKRAG